MDYHCIAIYLKVVATYVCVCAGTECEDIKEKYEGFIPQLTRCLPMKDAYFIAHLVAKGLFGNGNLKSEVEAKPTKAEAALHFLNEAISVHITINKVNLEPLYKLLKVMEKYGGAGKSLAKDIKEAIPYSGK